MFIFIFISFFVGMFLGHITYIFDVKHLKKTLVDFENFKRFYSDRICFMEGFYNELEKQNKK